MVFLTHGFVVFVFVGGYSAEFAFTGKKVRAAPCLAKPVEQPAPSSSHMMPLMVEEASKVDAASGDISVKQGSLKGNAKARAQTATAKAEKDKKKKRKPSSDPLTMAEEGKKKTRSGPAENPSNLSTIPEENVLPDPSKEMQAPSDDTSTLPLSGAGAMIVSDTVVISSGASLNLEENAPQVDTALENSAVLRAPGSSQEMVAINPTPTAPLEEANPEVGFVWAHPFPPDFPNSCGMNLPWLSQMVGAKERPSVTDDFCREASRVMPMGYLLEQLEQDPVKTIGGLIGPLVEAARALTHWRDLEASRKGKQPMAVVDEPRIAALEREKDAWKAEWAREKAKSAAAEAEILKLNEKVASQHSTIEEYQESEEYDRKMCAEHRADLKATREALKGAEDAFAEKDKENQAIIKRLVDELQVSKEEAIDAFLDSKGFCAAAITSMTPMMRAAMYDTLKDLSEHFPFRPEQLGFTQMPIEDKVPKKLPGYRWDRKNDIFYDPKNKKVKTQVELETCEPRELYYTWDSVAPWPLDCTKPSVLPQIRTHDPDQVPDTPGKGMYSGYSGEVCFLHILCNFYKITKVFFD